MSNPSHPPQCKRGDPVWLPLLALVVVACATNPSGVDTGPTSRPGTDPDEVPATVSTVSDAEVQFDYHDGTGSWSSARPPW